MSSVIERFPITDLTSTVSQTYSGWHLLSNVYNGDLDWKALYDGGHITNLESTYWKWDGLQYISYNAATNTGAAGATLPAFQAFWVHVVPLGQTGSITLQPPSSFNSASVPTPFDANWWLLQLSAKSGSLIDDQNWVGVHAQAASEWDARDSRFVICPPS